MANQLKFDLQTNPRPAVSPAQGRGDSAKLPAIPEPSTLDDLVKILGVEGVLNTAKYRFDPEQARFAIKYLNTANARENSVFVVADTGVGKSVLAILLAAHHVSRNERIIVSSPQLLGVDQLGKYANEFLINSECIKVWNEKTTPAQRARGYADPKHLLFIGTPNVFANDLGNILDPSLVKGAVIDEGDLALGVRSNETRHSTTALFKSLAALGIRRIGMSATDTENTTPLDKQRLLRATETYEIYPIQGKSACLERFEINVPLENREVSFALSERASLLNRQLLDAIPKSDSLLRERVSEHIEAATLKGASGRYEPPIELRTLRVIGEHLQTNRPGDPASYEPALLLYRDLVKVDRELRHALAIPRSARLILQVALEMAEELDNLVQSGRISDTNPLAKLASDMLEQKSFGTLSEQVSKNAAVNRAKAELAAKTGERSPAEHRAISLGFAIRQFAQWHGQLLGIGRFTFLSSYLDTFSKLQFTDDAKKKACRGSNQLLFDERKNPYLRTLSEAVRVAGFGTPFAQIREFRSWSKLYHHAAQPSFKIEPRVEISPVAAKSEFLSRTRTWFAEHPECVHPILPAIISNVRKEHLLAQESPKQLVFLEHKEGCELVADSLRVALGDLGVRPDVAYSSKGKEKLKTTQAFDRLREGACNVIVCTSVGNRSVSVPKIGAIHHYTLASVGKDIIQTDGRAGRDTDETAHIYYYTSKASDSGTFTSAQRNKGLRKAKDQRESRSDRPVRKVLIGKLDQMSFFDSEEF